jgi:hypothetical protein
MDKHTLFKKPFSKQGRKQFAHGRNASENMQQIDKSERKELKEKDAWGVLGYS